MIEKTFLFSWKKFFFLCLFLNLIAEVVRTLISFRSLRISRFIKQILSCHFTHMCSSITQFLFSSSAFKSFVNRETNELGNCILRAALFARSRLYHYRFMFLKHTREKRRCAFLASLVVKTKRKKKSFGPFLKKVFLFFCLSLFTLRSYDLSLISFLHFVPKDL